MKQKKQKNSQSSTDYYDLCINKKLRTNFIQQNFT